MKRILETTGATEYEGFISGGNNFRYTVFPEYKSNRKGKPDPIYRQDANAYLVGQYGGKVTDGYEADDAIGIAATTEGAGNCIICSIDKDLKTIAGEHYNWRKNEFTSVSELDAKHNFYRQFLTGDSADGIVGIKGLGPVKSSRLIDPLEDEVDMFRTVQALYADDARLLMNGRLLYLLRKEDDDWTTTYTRLSAESRLQE
jgi:DNA polymerase I